MYIIFKLQKHKYLGWKKSIIYYVNNKLQSNIYEMTSVCKTHTYIFIYMILCMYYIHIFIYQTYIYMGYIYKCVFVGMYLAETKKFECLRTKFLWTRISGRFIFYFMDKINITNNQHPGILACNWAKRHPRFPEKSVRRVWSESIYFSISGSIRSP